jgi:external thioesterase TEII
MNKLNNVKVIAFPFAGGSKYSFHNIFKDLPQVNVIEYPGRGRRMNEKLMDNIDLLIEDLLLAVKDQINNCEEYIIYGHSMGALIGYLICHKIRDLGMTPPVKLVVSGRKPPLIARKKDLSHLPDNLFWEEVIKLGGIPDELQHHPELMEFYIPILKSDFKIIENYNHVELEKLNLPIDVFYGTEEDITEEEIIQWKNESTEKVTIKSLEGNHFFIFNNENYFTNYFNDLNKKLNLSIN